MPLDEPVPSPSTDDWPEIDRRLLEQARPPGVPFPVRLLPGHWRNWVEATAQGFLPVDYVAQGLLAAVSAVCGGGVVAAVTPQWREPLVLWQALVGGPSSGKSPALAAARRLIDSLAPASHGDKILPPTILPNGTVEQFGRAMKDNMPGIVLWREELADWLTMACQPDVRAGWLAGWGVGGIVGRTRPGYTTMWQTHFALGIVGTMAPGRIARALADDDGFAARFLYSWPEPAISATLIDKTANDGNICAMLHRIALVVGSAAEPTTIAMTKEASARSHHLLPDLRQWMTEAEGAEAAWIGKGAGTIVRFAGLLALMEWAQAGAKAEGRIEACHVDAAHALWAEYFLPHARCVFDTIGVSEGDRNVRRSVRWLVRRRPMQVSREEIRCDALCRSVNAEGADEVIAHLEAGGYLRRIETERPKRGPARRLYAVNPALRRNSGNSGSAAVETPEGAETTS